MDNDIANYESDYGYDSDGYDYESDASGPYEEVWEEENTDPLEGDSHFWKLCPYGESWKDVDTTFITWVFDWKHKWFALFKQHKNEFRNVLNQLQNE